MIKDRLSPKYVVIAIVVLALLLLLRKSVFYAEPGYIYHVRTVTGDEQVVTDVGITCLSWGAGMPGNVL